MVEAGAAGNHHAGSRPRDRQRGVGEPEPEQARDPRRAPLAHPFAQLVEGTLGAHAASMTGASAERKSPTAA